MVLVSILLKCFAVNRYSCQGSLFILLYHCGIAGDVCEHYGRQLSFVSFSHEIRVQCLKYRNTIGLLGMKS